MRSWRNWQTRKTKDLVGNSMQVQFLSTAPQRRKSLSRFPFLFYVFLDRNWGTSCPLRKTSTMFFRDETSKRISFAFAVTECKENHTLHEKCRFARANGLPCVLGSSLICKANWTIDNRPLGRAAKGAIPVDRTTKIGCPLGHPIFVCRR